MRGGRVPRQPASERARPATERLKPPQRLRKAPQTARGFNCSCASAQFVREGGQRVVVAAVYARCGSKQVLLWLRTRRCVGRRTRLGRRVRAGVIPFI